jgi:lipoprotein-anchoring transpeptidase ErfK/SrfK
MGIGRLARMSAAVVALATLVPLGVVGCSSGGETPTFVEPSVAASPKPSLPPLALEITPAAQSANLPASTEIGTKVTSGKVSSVTLADDSGVAVAGEMKADGTSWVPAAPLAFKKNYTATVVATGEDGKTVTQTTSFATMSKPGKTAGAGLYLFSDREYGVAMPVVVEFPTPIPEDARAGVQSRLFVTTDPPQPGVWAWSSGKQAQYRAAKYWQPGTKITVRVALGGHPMGGGRYGDKDRAGVGNISAKKIEMIVDNTTKHMQVLQNDVEVKSIPVSLGSAKFPSSSGTMVVMDKQVETVFDTRNDPTATDRYVVDIQYAQRLTWGGEFIHSAPWSVKDQGVRNVSHGCVNMSAANAKWLFDLTRIGDPVTVKGTERVLADGNGWTAWTLPWSEYIKHSALPVAPELAGADSSAPASASPSASTAS